MHGIVTASDGYKDVTVTENRLVWRCSDYYWLWGGGCVNCMVGYRRSLGM